MKSSYKSSLNFRLLAILILLLLGTINSIDQAQQVASSQESGEGLPKGYLVFKNGGFQHTLSKDNIYKLYLTLIFFMLGLFLLLFSIQFTCFLSLKMIKKMQLTDLLMKNKIIEPSSQTEGNETYNPILEVEELSIDHAQNEETTQLQFDPKSTHEAIPFVNIDKCKENRLYTAVGKLSIVCSPEKHVPESFLKLIEEEKKANLVRVEVIIERLSSIINKDWDKDFENSEVYENDIYLKDPTNAQATSNLTVEFSTVKERCERTTIKWNKEDMPIIVKCLESIAYTSILSCEIHEMYIDEETNHPTVEIVYPNESEYIYFTLIAKKRDNLQLLRDSPVYDFDKLNFLKNNDLRVCVSCYVSQIILSDSF